MLPGSNRIVVADTGNKRIVVASSDGRFIRQIVSPTFTDLRAVAVDEGAAPDVRPQRRHRPPRDVAPVSPATDPARVIAPSLALDTSAAYFAITPVV